MIITSLILENIRSYKDATFEFEEGITFLSGDIGSGKSSILQAIEFALFGFKRGDLEGQQLLRRGSAKGSVTLRLKKGNNIIEIYRSLKKSKTTINQENGYIKIDDTLAELSPSEINAHLFEILHFPRSFLNKDRHLIYRFCVYTPQEQLKEILYSENDKRLEVIRKLFSIDKYKQLTSGIELYTKDLRDKKLRLKTKLEEKDEIFKRFKELSQENKNQLNYLGDLEKKIKPLKKEVDELHKNSQEYSQKNEEVQNKRLKVQTALEKLNAYSQRLGEINEEIKSLEKNISDSSSQDIQKKIKTIEKTIGEKEKDIDNEKKSYQELISQQEKLQNYLIKQEEIKSLEKQLKKFNESNYSNLKDEIALLQKELEKIEALYHKEEKSNKEKQEISLEIYSIKESISRLKNEENSITSKESCSLCKQTIPHSHKEEIKQNYEIKIKELNEKEKSLDKKLISINKELEYFQKQKEEEKKLYEKLISKKEQLKQLKTAKEEHAQLDEKLKKLKKEIETPNSTSKEELKNKISKSTNNIEMLQKETSSQLIEQEQLISFLHTLSEKKNKLKELEDKKERLILQLEKKTSIEETNTKLNKAFEVLQDKQKKNQELLKEKQPSLENLTTLKTQIETTISSQKTQLKEQENRIKKLETIESELKKILDKEHFLQQEATTISSKVEKKLFTKFYVLATQEFTRIFKELIEDNELEVRLNEEFSILIEQNGYDIDIKHLSGGEKSSLAIAYKLALKKTIESFFPQEHYLDVLMLDEPTDGFSAEQVQRLGLLLKELSVGQIFLVSHDEKIESIAEHLIEIEKKNHVSSSH